MASFDDQNSFALLEISSLGEIAKNLTPKRSCSAKRCSSRMLFSVPSSNRVAQLFDNPSSFARCCFVMLFSLIERKTTCLIGSVRLIVR